MPVCACMCACKPMAWQLPQMGLLEHLCTTFGSCKPLVWEMGDENGWMEGAMRL